MNKKNDVLSLNTSAIMREIWLEKTTTQIDISKKLSLNPSTVSRIIGRLEEYNFIHSQGVAEIVSHVGRKPRAVSLNTAFGYVVGIEIQTDTYHAVAMDLYGAVLHRLSGALPPGIDIISECIGIISRIQGQCDESAFKMIGVSIGVPAVIDPYEGCIHRSNPFEIRTRLDFVSAIKAHVNVPVLLENDANCCCWGELSSRGQQRPKNMIYLLGGFRKYKSVQREGFTLVVGIGIVIDGRVYHGMQGSAGEFKSVLWKPGNDSQFSFSNIEILRLEHDLAERRTALRELALHVAYTANILDVSHVIVGGNICEDKAYIEQLLAEEIIRNNSYDLPLQCEISFSSDGDYAVAYGAGAMFLEHLFAIPNDGRDTPLDFLGVHLLNQIVANN